ncbi:hypothetical protein C8R45DRAFT_942426 [Mycena sanguinolenta]|nr:hypothetical protein C8R45DRAFT_942426 [Mycena sanguinolenta]
MDIMITAIASSLTLQIKARRTSYIKHRIYICWFEADISTPKIEICKTTLKIKKVPSCSSRPLKASKPQKNTPEFPLYRNEGQIKSKGSARIGLSRRSVAEGFHWKNKPVRAALDGLRELLARVERWSSLPRSHLSICAGDHLPKWSRRLGESNDRGGEIEHSLEVGETETGWDGKRWSKIVPRLNCTSPHYAAPWIIEPMLNTDATTVS